MVNSVIMIYKLLDLLHDYVLCPIFGDHKKNAEQYDKILDKLSEIESLIINMRDQKNGK